MKGRDINPNCSILDALKKMDRIDRKLLIVIENKKFLGLLSIGDIQRAVIRNIPLSTSIIEILRKNTRIANPQDSFEEIRNIMINFRMELCPVVDNNQKIIDIYFWEDLFKEQKIKSAKQFDLPVVIMAGGVGSRLKPLTNVLPKPLIPINEKTMLEEIFDRFVDYGCNNFYISVNYKADLIEYYIRNLNLPYTLEFYKEEKPMGTAGSLSLLKGKIDQTFFVSNCDILIDQDYSEVLDYHRNNKNEITIVAALKHFPIAYGTIETGENGYLTALVEKPELTFKINSGMYILEPHLLLEIPTNKFSHITDLINTVLERNGSIGVFPVSEKSWKDIGEMSEYLNILKPKQ